jgi:ribosome-associated protein
MITEELKKRILTGELFFSASRSGGPGGQNVNKVNTKVELRFNVLRSSGLSDSEKEKIQNKLRNRINADGDLIITSQSERTQIMNRKKAEEKFFSLLSAALTEKPERKPTSATPVSKAKRLAVKKRHGAIKTLRRDSSISDQDN